MRATRGRCARERRSRWAVNLRLPASRRWSRKSAKTVPAAPLRPTKPPAWLPPEDISQPVRLTAFRLFGRDHNPAAVYATNGLLIQGLLQIHRDLCLRLHPDCDDCALGSPPGLGIRMADFLRDGD